MEVETITPQANRLTVWFAEFLKTYIPPLPANYRVGANDAGLTQEEITQQYYSSFSHSSKYMSQLVKLPQYNSHTLYIDTADLFNYDHSYATTIVDNFLSLQPALEAVVESVAESVLDRTFIYDANVSSKKLRFSLALFNLAPAFNITPKDVECRVLRKLTCLTGTVTRMSDISHQLNRAHYVCKRCNVAQDTFLQTYALTPPSKCRNPQCKADKPYDFELDFHKSEFIDFQKLKIQENSNDIEPGRMPQTVDVIVRGEIVDTCKPGDRVHITGSVIAVPNISYHDISVASASDSRDGPITDDSKGVTLGVQNMSYKLLYLASHIAQSSLFIRDDPGDVLLALRNSTGRAINKGSTDNRLDPYKDQLDALTESFEYYMNSFQREGQTYEQALDTLIPHLPVLANREPDAFVETLSDEQQETIKYMVHRAQEDTEAFLHDLTVSFASHIEGLEHVKLAILLLLAGGVPKHTENEGMALRGDINICLVGDPSVAKSQFLKFVAQLDPRTVYTSGKSSSAAGLTAAVVKDIDSGDFTVEAGALILADQSVCCLDEFEKLDEIDRVAIHEAMEQQSISISKAGIQCTLNARSSILAAMNPVYGRYRKDKSLRENVTLPPSLLSRFDLIFVITDNADPALDRRIAQKILDFHRETETSPIVSPFDNAQLGLYLEFSSKNQPLLTEEVCELLVRKFVQMRQRDANAPNASFTMTVRQLESMIRLCEAHAKLRASSDVTIADVRAVLSIIEKANIQTETGDVVFEDDEDIDEEPQVVGDVEYLDEQEEEPIQRPTQRPVLTLTGSEYKTWSSEIIGMVSEQNGITAGEIIRKMLELHVDKVDLDDYSSFTKLVTRVLSRMVATDNVLIITSVDVDNEEDITFDIHPGFLH